MDSFKEYLQSIMPTKRGTLCVLAIALFLPLLVDLVLYAFSPSAVSGFSILLFLTKGYFLILILVAVYLMVFYVLKRMFRKQ